MTDTIAVEGTGCPYHPPVMPRDGTAFRPSPTFAEWRAEAPAIRIAAEDGNIGWFVTGYELAREVLEDPRFHQGHRYPLGQPMSLDGFAIDDRTGHALMMGNVLSLDPPQHTRIRRTVTARFSVRSVRSHLPALGEFIGQRLDAILAAGTTAELFRDLALPVSVFAHCRVLGIPAERADEFAATFAGNDLSIVDMMGFVREVLEAKSEDLAEDTISDLLRSDLTRPEMEGIAMILMASGRDAIAFMIGTNMVSLLTNPDQLETLRRDPELIPAAVEEFIRFNAMFVSTHPRTVAEDVELQGIGFREGESVWVSTVAANRDGDRFDDPETFDVTRDAYGHLGFGHGIHGCIGQQLARAVIAEAIAQLLRRLPRSLRLVEAEQLDAIPFAGNLPTYAPGAVRVAWE